MPAMYGRRQHVADSYAGQFPRHRVLHPQPAWHVPSHPVTLSCLHVSLSRAPTYHCPMATCHTLMPPRVTLHAEASAPAEGTPWSDMPDEEKRERLVSENNIGAWPIHPPTHIGA